MLRALSTKFVPLILGLLLAGCSTLASEGSCAVPVLSEDELWQLEPEDLNPLSAPPKVSKTQLIELVAGKTNLNKLEAGQAIDALLESMSEELKKGNTIGLPGFGTVRVSYTKARNGRNPKTGATIQIPATSRLSIKTASTLKAELPKEDPFAEPPTPPATP